MASMSAAALGVGDTGVSRVPRRFSRQTPISLHYMFIITNIIIMFIIVIINIDNRRRSFDLDIYM